MEAESSDVGSVTDPDTTELTTSSGPASNAWGWERDWLQNICYWYNVTLFIVVIGALCIGGLVGNTLTRLTLWPDRTKSATVFLIICLSIVDDMVLVFYGFMLMAYMLAYMDGIIDTEFPNFYARIWNVGWALSSTLQVIAAWVVLVISVQRYIAVCQPFLAKKFNTVRSARIVLFVVVLGSAAFNFPRLFKYNVVENSSGRLRNVFTTFASSESYRVGYELIAYYILVYIIPMSILVYTSVRLLLALRQSKKKRAQMVTNSQQTTTSRLQDEMTRSVVVVVLVFCVCQMANPTRRILEEITSPSQQTCGTFYFFFSALSAVSVIFNSAANFVIFCVCAHGFRGQVMTRLSRWRHNRQVHAVSSTVSTSTTRAAEGSV